PKIFLSLTQAWCDRSGGTTIFALPPGTTTSCVNQSSLTSLGGNSLTMSSSLMVGVALGRTKVLAVFMPSSAASIGLSGLKIPAYLADLRKQSAHAPAFSFLIVGSLASAFSS